jgi:hypothetical protein
VIVDDDQVVQKATDGQTKITRKARTPEELQKIQGIVAAAVGLKADRGDRSPFKTCRSRNFPPKRSPLTTLQQVWQYTPQIWEGARMLVVGIVGLLAMMRRPYNGPIHGDCPSSRDA